MQNTIQFCLGLRSLLVLCLLATCGLQLPIVNAQAPSVPAEELLSLEGKQVDLVLSNKSILANQTVVQATVTDDGKGLKILKVRPEGSTKAKTIRLNSVQEIYLKDRPLDVAYDRKARQLRHDPEKRQAREDHEKEVADVLESQGHRFWPLLEQADHEVYLKRHHEFVEKCKSALSDIPLQTIETEHFIVTTDLSPSEVNNYLAYLDEMYRLLCTAFGLSPEKNIWCGKCVIMAFGKAETYHRFESEVMKVSSEGTQGLCHQSSDGTVIFAGYKGDSDYFGHVLVHETTHGFVHRYMSSARLPSWLNEGISDWLADAVVKGDRGAIRARQTALSALAAGGLGDFLTSERIPLGSYGTACSMVEILVARDRGTQFKQFLVWLKEGRDPETSLQEAFGLSYKDLEALYAASIRRLR